MHSPNSMASDTTTLNEGTVPAAVPADQGRFFMDHGVWHDRETGKHLFYEGESPEAAAVNEAWDALAAAGVQRDGWRTLPESIAKLAALATSAPPPVEAREPKLVGYDECRCIMTQYCDGQCRPIYEDADVVDRARMLYAEHPTYRGTTPLPWHYAPMVARKEWVDKARAELAATHPKEPTEAREASAEGAARPDGAQQHE